MNPYRMRMSVNYSEINTNELEYDGGISTLGWACIGICAVLLISGCAMILGAQDDVFPVAIPERLRILRPEGSRRDHSRHDLRLSGHPPGGWT